MTRDNRRIAHAHASGLWRIAQVVGVLATVGLLAGLLVAPEAALTVLWSIAVPVLPATFLVSPTIWRNVCPLATLNMLPAARGQRVALAPRLVPALGVVAIALLLLLVPARRVLFNRDGLVLAVTIGVVAVLAVVMGTVFDSKAGFCNSICPVLPVERLYGQAPMLAIKHARCPSCSACTGHACMDLQPRRHLPHVLGPDSGGVAWLKTAWGAFAAAFPGFVLGYWWTEDGAVETVASVYLVIGALSLGSYALVALVTLTWKPSRRLVMPLLAAAAVGIYYWYASPAIAEDLALPAAVGTGLRLMTIALMALWLQHAARKSAAKPSLTDA